MRVRNHDCRRYALLCLVSNSNDPGIVSPPISLELENYYSIGIFAYISACRVTRNNPEITRTPPPRNIFTLKRFTICRVFDPPPS